MTSELEGKRWGRSWMVSADLESRLVSPVLTTTQHPDLDVWRMERKYVILLELTVPWEESISDAEYRKE